MNNDKIVAIFNDTVTDNALADIAKKHDGLVHDFGNEEQFKAARKVNTEMNKLLKAVDTVGIAAAKQVTTTRNELKEKIELAYSGTVTPFSIEDQKRKDEAKRIKEKQEARIAEQQAKLNIIKGAAARAIHLPIDDIEDILQEVMSIDLEFFDDEMKEEARAAKEISLSALQDAFRFAEEREEARKAKELHEAELSDKDDEIARLMEMLAEKEPKLETKADEEWFLGDEQLHGALLPWFDNNDVCDYAIKELEEIFKTHS